MDSALFIGMSFSYLSAPQRCIKPWVNLVSLDHIMSQFAFYAYLIVLYIEESLLNCDGLTF